MLSAGDRCPARIELSDFQIRWLMRRPFAAQQVRRHHECRLEFRHDGAHGDIGQQSDEVEWWVRWTLTTSTVEQGQACATACEATEHAEGADCLLFEGHPGRHSFDLDPR